MRKIKNESGFGSTELILIIVVVVLLGVLGWFVYKRQHKTTNNAATAATSTTVAKTSTTTPPPADPYTGWKSYTLAKEKLSLKYPSSLTLKDNTSSSDSGDSLKLTGSNGFTLYVSTGLFDFSLPAGGATVDQASSITFAGQQGYLDFYEGGTQKTDNVIVVGLSTSATNPGDLFKSKNASANSNGRINFDIQYLDANGKMVPKPVSAIQNDADYKNAVLVIKSATY